MADREYNVKSWRSEDVARLKQLIKDGCTVNQEIEDLKAGLNETVKAIAEELEIKPSQLNRAIRIAYKETLHDEREAMQEIEDILDVTGRGL